MNAKKAMLAAVMQAVVVIVFNAPALAVTHTTTNIDALSTGEWNGPQQPTTTTAATVTAMLCGDAVGGGSCYQAVIANPFAFSYADTITLPTLGATFDGGFVDATFRATTLTHENWHRAYADALLNRTYGALETWSASYESNKVDSEAGALALGNTDLAAALQVAINAFAADRDTDVNNAAFGHQNAVAVIQNIAGVDTWRSQNPDWGQAAVNYANTINVAFAKGPGNCELVPEPAAGMIFAFNVLALAAVRRRAH